MMKSIITCDLEGVIETINPDGEKLFGYKNQQINEFNLENIELLIKSKSLENKLIKPVYPLN